MKATTSDPGTTASLTPFCKTDGLYFDGSNEPEEFKYAFDKDINDNIPDDDFIKPSYKTMEEYFNASFHIESTTDLIDIKSTEIEKEGTEKANPINVRFGSFSDIDDDEDIDEDEYELIDDDDDSYSDD